MGVIPNPKMAFIFLISCILALIFPILIEYFPKCVGKGNFLKSQIKSLTLAPSFLIGSFSFLQTTRKPIISGIGLKFSRIPPGAYELPALERLEKSP